MTHKHTNERHPWLQGGIASSRGGRVIPQPEEIRPSDTHNLACLNLSLYKMELIFLPPGFQEYIKGINEPINIKVLLQAISYRIVINVSDNINSLVMNRKLIWGDSSYYPT